MQAGKRYFECKHIISETTLRVQKKKISLFTLMHDIYRVLCFPGRRLRIDSAGKWGEKILIVGYHKGK